MQYAPSIYPTEECKNVITCAILAKPKENVENWPAGIERAVTHIKIAAGVSYEEVQRRAVEFAKKYISERNKTIWHNNAIFSSVMFLFPNGMVKRYTHV